MFTPLMNKRTDERGALMIEAIALLGLMTMMSPMVVRQTADRTVEMEDVAIAGQMKELKDALSNWIEANYASIKSACSGGGTIAVAGGVSCSNAADSHFAVPVAGLAPYLPATYLETVTGSNNSTSYRLRGNKLADGFDIGVRAQCTEGTNTSTGATCGSMGADGVWTGLDSACKCSRYKVTGVVLSNGASEIDDRRAARIATMIGADGGFVRTSNMVSNVLNNSGRTTIVGAQGIWEGDATNYIVGYNSSVGGRVAATTIYSSGFSGDYLYRKQVDGLPGANSMFTNLDMGGAIECNGTQCHKINNAGGLEVVGGKILIRSQNTANGQDQEEGEGDGYARVLLGSDTSHINMTNSLSLGVSGTTSSSLNMTNFRTDLNASNISILANNQASLSGREALMYADDWIDIMSSQDVNLSAARTMDIYSQNKMYLTASNQMQLVSNNRMYLNASQSMMANAPYLSMNALNAVFVNVGRGGAYIQIGNGYYSQDLKTLNYHSNIFRGSTYSYSTIANGTQVNQSMSAFVVRAMPSNGSASYAAYDNNKASFGLYNMHNTSATFQVNLFNVSGNYARRMIYNQEGLTLFANTAGGIGRTGIGQFITFADGNGQRSQIRAIANNDLGEAVVVFGNMGKSNSLENLNSFNPVYLYGDSGRVSGTFFQPRDLSVNAHTYNNMIVNRARIQIDENTGRTASGGTISNTDSYYRTAYVDINTGNLGGAYSPYQAHLTNDRDKYKNFRVDPAFVSVMNDIKITSRGGARLSEALPNYILKGIYQLSNDYAYGGWPCGESSASGETPPWKSLCSYSMPYMTFDQLGMVNGGWEFNCSKVDSSHEHPVKAGGGSCACSEGEGKCDGASGTEKNGKYVTFTFGPDTPDPEPDLNNRNTPYRECPTGSFCWAHPFMGIVPAPGRTVSYAAVNASGASVTEIQSAQDEGVCPDGYQAVMTLTPNSFDVARVLYSRHDDGYPISYNPGWQNFEDSSNNYAVHGIRIMQPSQRMIVMQQPRVNSNGQVLGWKIAMGFASYYNDDEGKFVWNVGGVGTGSWSALAHTYCYFNPQRFDMPNMRFIKLNDNGTSSYNGEVNDIILTPMDNPILDDSTYKRWMN